MANTRFGWHSGNVIARDLTLSRNLTVSGNFTFGDASTDTLTVTGKLDANGNVDLGSGDDTINLGATTGDTINLKSTLLGASGVDITLSGGADVTVGATGKLYCRNIDAASTGNVNLAVDAAGGGTITVSGTSTGGIVLADDVSISDGKTFDVGMDGAASVAGTATLVNGSITISTTSIAASDVILLNHLANAGTVGVLTIESISAGTNFVVHSVDPVSGSVQANDDNAVGWFIVGRGS